MSTNTTAKGISRRNFLVGTGAVAAAAAGTSLMGCTPQKQSSKSDEGTATSAADAAQQSNLVHGELLNPQDYDYRSNSGDVSHIFTPWKLGGYEIPNRIVKSAAGSHYENGSFDAFIEYYRRLAAGGPGWIWVETFVNIFTPGKSTINANIDDYTDEQVQALTAAIHNEGCKCGTQTGMMGAEYFTGLVKRGGGKMLAETLTAEDMDYIVECFHNAARTFKHWGFDGMTINCAGNTFLQWFFSASRNHRDDEYGTQSFENRCRLIGRIFDAIHEEVGYDFPIEVLIDAINENDQEIGQNAEYNTIEDNIEIAKQLEKLGAASIHVRLGPANQHATQFLGDLYFDARGCIGSTSFGGQFDFSRHFEGKLVADHSGCGLMLNIAKMFKDELSIPVGTVTYMDPAHAPDMFDKAIADGMVDYMLMNRPLNVDPQYPNKLKEGRIDEIRPCTRCCHCWNDTYRGDPYFVTSVGSTNYACRLDPVRDAVDQADKGLPGGFDPDPGDGDKDVMVVGGGPAGMEAARIAAQRGYSVTLYEKKASVGGLLTFAAAIKGPHQNLEDYRDWSKRDLELKGVEIVCNQEVDADFIKQKNPDVVILAMGGKRGSLGMSPTDKTNIISIDDVVNQADAIGENVTIVGSNCQALDIATYLMEQGKKVTIVTPDEAEQLGKGQSLWTKRFSIPALYAHGLKVWKQGELLEIGDGEVTVQTWTGSNVTYECDTVIEAMDMLTNDDMINELNGIDAHAVGDCNDPYSIQYAIRSGNYTARAI